MTKLECKCGNLLSTRYSPTPEHGIFMDEFDIDKFLEHKIIHAIYDNSVEVWRCHDCNRIAIGNKENFSLKWYKAEE